LLLAEQTGADAQVVEVFAFIHDAERRNDFSDPEHGTRAAKLATEINNEFFKLTVEQLYTLIEACEGHSLGGGGRSRHHRTNLLGCQQTQPERTEAKPRPDKRCMTVTKQHTMIQRDYSHSLKMPAH